MLEYSADAKKQFNSLDHSIQIKIKKYMGEVIGLENPRSSGKELKSNLAGLWRYSIGDYRII